MTREARHYYPAVSIDLEAKALALSKLSKVASDSTIQKRAKSVTDARLQVVIQVVLSISLSVGRGNLGMKSEEGGGREWGFFLLKRGNDRHA